MMAAGPFYGLDLCPFAIVVVESKLPSNSRITIMNQPISGGFVIALIGVLNSQMFADEPAPQEPKISGSPSEQVYEAEVIDERITETAASVEQQVDVAEKTADQQLVMVSQVIRETDDLSTFQKTLTTTGLIETLDGAGPFTVFAPSNDAFEDLPDGVLENLMLPENVEMLTEILMNHIVAGTVNTEAVRSSQLKMKSGKTIPTAESSVGVVVGDAKITKGDLPATNGIVHVVDAVLLPE